MELKILCLIIICFYGKVDAKNKFKNVLRGTDLKEYLDKMPHLWEV